MKRLLVGGRVIDPSQNLDQNANVLIEDGKIAAISPDLAAGEGCEVVDVSGKIVSPGWIDLHVHLREPGREEDETIASGCRAAVAGGFTAVTSMPNTSPPVDTQAVVKLIQGEAEAAGLCRVHVVACVSHDREGKQLAEMGQLHKAGAVAFSDDGSPVFSDDLMRRALQYSLMFDKPILGHAEVLELTEGGVMHEGMTSMLLGLPGMPAAAEVAMVARDIALVEATGGRYHLQHVSTAGAVDAIRRAKARGLNVTAEACPHHFSMTDKELRSFDSNYKMNPPLRGEQDVEAILAGLADGTIDAIATDHAPHASEKKMQELDVAPFGIVGLETALGLIGTKLVETGVLTWSQAIEKVTAAPARILGLSQGTLKIGSDADITVIDPEKKWEVTQESFKGKSANSPFLGWHLTGKSELVFVGGKMISSDGKS